MKYPIIFYTALSALVLCLATCRQADPDPCARLKPFEADFVIKEQVADSAYITDTVLIDNFISFEALGDYDSYQWRIGEDPRTFTTKTVRLRFPEPLTSLLQIQLIATKSPRTECFPEDNGVDTVVKTLKVLDYGQSKLIGKYRGANSDKPDDVFEVTIDYGNFDRYSPGLSFYFLENWVKGCLQRYITGEIASFVGNDAAIGYNLAYLNRKFLAPCQCEGWFSVDSSGQILTINGEYEKSSKDMINNIPPTQVEFKGSRLP